MEGGRLAVPVYRAPGIYIEELSRGAKPIEGVGTSVFGVVGEAPNSEAHVNQAKAVNNWRQFTTEFTTEDSVSTPLSHAVSGFFMNGGGRCYVVNVGKGGSIAGGGRRRAGLQVLEEIDEVAIVAAPGYTDVASYEALLSHCELLKDRVAILDAAPDLESIDQLLTVATVKAPTVRRSSGAEAADPSADKASDTTASTLPDPKGPRRSRDAALYFPGIYIVDALSRERTVVEVAPSGHMAGVWARNDATRGVHAAPANMPIAGALGLSYQVTRQEQEELNSAGVNCLRYFPDIGVRVWGARTLSEDPEWRYLNVRRLFNFVEESIAEGTNWIVFESNTPSLWENVKRDAGHFLNRLWRDGALMGASPQEAYYVRCDAEINPPESVDAGVLVVEIGIAPVKPAEFVVFRLSQWAGGSRVETPGGTNG